MTRRNLIHKWLVYGLALFPIWFLDSVLLSRYPVGGVHAILLPLAVVAVAGLEGSVAGAGFGLYTGLIWACAYSGSEGSRILGLALMGMVVGIVSQYALSQTFLGYSISCVYALGTMELWYFMWRLFFRVAPAGALLNIAIRELLWTLVWMPLVYFLFRAVHRRVGNAKLGTG